jgi:hypothetical protein
MRSAARTPPPFLRDLLDAPTALAACCGFDLCHKYILYLYLYFLDKRCRALGEQALQRGITTLRAHARWVSSRHQTFPHTDKHKIENGKEQHHSDCALW